MIYSIPSTHHFSFRDWISTHLVEIFKPFYIMVLSRKKRWQADADFLKKLPKGSLGHDLFLFLRENNFKLIPKAESHDVLHVLLGYDTSIVGEACLQTMLMANGKRSLPTLVTSLVSQLFYPENREQLHQAYLRGEAAHHFHSWNFEVLLHVPTQEVRKMIFEKREVGFF